MQRLDNFPRGFFPPTTIFFFFLKKGPFIFSSNACIELISMFRALFHLEFTFVYSVSPDGEPVVPIPFTELSIF